MHQRGHVPGQGAVRLAQVRPLRRGLLQLADLPRIPVGEDPEQPAHGRVLDVDPVLVEGVGTGHPRVQPHGIALGLAELLPTRVGHQRGGHHVHRLTRHPVDQVHARDQVAPLVDATGLQGAAVLAVQVQVVHRLQDLVAELGVGDPLLAGQPGSHRVLADHLVDPEVLTHVTQEVQRAERAGPLQVVDHDRRVVPVELQ